MNDVWNQRYAMAGYAYGTEPNAFLAEHAALLSGPVLCWPKAKAETPCS